MKDEETGRVWEVSLVQGASGFKTQGVRASGLIALAGGVTDRGDGDGEACF